MQFDFGKKWADFSEKALTPKRGERTRQVFIALLELVRGVAGVL